ncbi:HNH endonuclease signature motif containing protein [Subtercola endophyticus]|uniref:HNH endonuclease signature motif containing protein n=1 Tax=Subtercola endophyticus TaxID=2895559 RepID=UPI001E61174C|nr:HNH endonuclease signature motif containing protein [Subtercola endophyticus]UFS57498.1 HNH endonuclease [Subtercola endophyticus]
MKRAILIPAGDDDPGGDNDHHLDADRPMLRAAYASSVAAVLEGEREAARASAEQATRIDRMRRAALALHFADQSSGGPKWTPDVVVQRTVVTELAVGARLSEADARRKIDTAQGLCGAFAQTRRALERGLISYRHAEKIVQHARLLPDDRIDDYEARILPAAQRASAQRLERDCRAAVEEAQPTTAIQRHLDACAERRLSLDPGSDGMAYLTMFLPAVEAVAIFNRATDLARSLKNAGDPRTLTQLRIDTIADLALNAESSIPGATRGIRAHVRLTVPALTLVAPSTPSSEAHMPEALQPAEASERKLDASETGGPANLEGYGPIDRLTALELTRDAPGFERVLTDPATGIALNYGRQRYKPPADLEDLIRTVHNECTFPLSCSPSATADLDHTRPFSDGGSTEFGNLSPLCSSHHKVKHHTEWRVEQHPGAHGTAATITWTSPAGFSYVVEPTPIARPVPIFVTAPTSLSTDTPAPF